MTREEAVSYLEFEREQVLNKSDGITSNLTESYDMAIEELQEPERKKGRWENGEPCPICGEDRFKDLYADIWADWQPPFCPNCGADMRGESE